MHLHTNIKTAIRCLGIRSIVTTFAVLVLMVAMPLLGPAGIVKTVVQIKGGDVTKLLDMIENPNHEGYRIVLAPGTYRIPRELILQPHMDLVGSQEWDSIDENGVPVAVKPGTETIIDVSDINETSYDGSQIIQVGNDNHIERLTITRSNAGPFRGILGPSSGIQDAGWQFVMSDCIIDIPNPDTLFAVMIVTWPISTGTDSLATLTRNILRSPNGGLATLLSFSVVGGGSPSTVENATKTLVLTNNRISGGAVGLSGISWYNSNYCKLSIISTRNIYENASNSGISLTGGSWPAFPGDNGSDYNSIDFTSTEDIIRNNGVSGVRLIGGDDSYCFAMWPHADYNTVSAFFNGTQFSNNGTTMNPVDIVGKGENSCPLASGNTVNIFTQDTEPLIDVTQDPNNPVKQGVWIPFP